MRIFVIEPHAVGGMIHYVYQLCTALAAHGADVTLVTAAGYEMADHPHTFTVVTPLRRWAAFDPRSSQPPRGKLARLARALHWQARRAMRALRLVHEWIKLSRFLLRQRPDIVQFGKINFPFEAVFLAYLRRRGLRLADICHEFELREQASNPLARLSNRLYRHVYNQFVVRAQDRDGLQAHLEAQGIGTAVYYPRPLHLQPCFADLGYGPGDFPESERACAEVLALPVYPELAPDQLAQVVRAVAGFYGV